MNTAEQLKTAPNARNGLPENPDTPAPKRPEGLSATLREMIRELVQYRELLGQMILRDIRIRYKQAIMGFGWAVLMPVVIVGAGFLVKYAMAQISGKPLEAASLSGMTVKALGWAFFIGALGFATNSLTSNIALVTKIYFPREVFPLSAVLTQAFDSLIGSTVLGMLLFLFLGVGLSLQLLWVPLLIVMLILMTTGAALFLSCANVFFRDVKYLVQVVITFGIFFTPVFYEPQFFGPKGCLVMMLNPLSPLLEGLRLAVVEQHNLLETLVVTTDAGQEIFAWQPWYLLYAAAWSIFGSIGAWLMFHKLEFVYAEYI